MSHYKLTREEYQRMHALYPGQIDSEGGYIKGSEVQRRYEVYKAADNAAGIASTTYKETKKTLWVDPPYGDRRVTGPVQSKMYEPKDHKTLEQLAGRAASTAGT